MNKNKQEQLNRAAEQQAEIRRLNNGEVISEEEYQRRVRQFRELLDQPWSSSKVALAENDLWSKYRATKETIPSPEKEQKQIHILYQSVLNLHKHLVAWEDARQKDLDWKRSIEVELRKALAQMQSYLENWDEQLTAVVNGKSPGQDGMITLVLDSLNSLQDRVSTLEQSRTLSAGVAKRVT